MSMRISYNADAATISYSHVIKYYFHALQNKAADPVYTVQNK